MDIVVILYGSKFSPKALSEAINMPIESKQEYGDLAKRGKYKGKPSPSGKGWVLTKPEDISSNKDMGMIDMLEKHLKHLSDNIEKVRGCNVETICVHIILRENDELYLNNKIITLISKLNASFESVVITNNIEWLGDRLK